MSVPAEFEEKRRIDLITALKEILEASKAKIASATLQACLWFSDIENLQKWIDDAQNAPAFLMDMRSGIGC
jgi:hypothetical protein